MLNFQLANELTSVVMFLEIYLLRTLSSWASSIAW
jgi:hypothetical protein